VMVTSRNQAVAQRNGEPNVGGELITFTSTGPDNRQQLTIIDPQTRAMAIYHVDAATGVVSLKSVRNIQWDLRMSEFNAVGPLPREIRAMVENH